MRIKFYTENNLEHNNKVGSTKYIKQIKEYYLTEHKIDMEIIPVNKPKTNILIKFIAFINLIFNTIPVQITYRQKANRNIETNNSELTFIEGIYLGPFVSDKNNCILLAQDSLSRLQFSIASQTKKIFKKLYYIISGYSYLMLELNLYKKFKKVIFVSGEDLKYIESQGDFKNLELLEIGLDFEDLYESNSVPLLEDITKRYGEYIIFTGNMTYPPNRDAAKILVEKIFPLIREKNITVKLLLVGIESEKFNDPTNNIYGIGKVESIKEYIGGSQLYISPLFSGSGMKNKILESFAQKTLTLASPKSVEGIKSLENNYHYIKCETHNEFSEKVIDILKNPKKYKQIEDLGYKFVKEKHLFTIKNAKNLGSYL
ncbi:glycosyltransferase family 4 protein [Bacillus haimaensis]|uniref:glycosyltransferase family 4 protein n=1 Tax=Bacillus haimaensis TaxID=3160967 RepID=UPI003AA9588A